MANTQKWPYESKVGKTTHMEADVLVLGGGIAGCMAAIAAAKKGQSVILVEKGATKRSGAGGSGCDHWESAATNPCSGVTPEELTAAMMDDNDGYNNAISHYIECREGWDRLQEIEQMGGKIRDTEDEFKGADFRDEETKLMFAYDYKNKFTIRIWGTTFKPAMEKELKRLGVKIVDRVMVTSLLTEGGKNGAKCIGATGIHTRTGEFYVFTGKASIITMSRPARVWLFSSAHPGLCEFRPMTTIGDGHAMGWRIGAEFNMMEKSVRAQFSSAGRSFPPYSAGNNHNTWYPASMIDAEGKEIPYADRDGNILPDVKSRFYPAEGQHYFLKGGNIEEAKYEYEGPETLPYDKLKEMGYKLPFYADLSSMPEMERKVIWGMMVGQEGKTNVPVYKNFTEAGFDPEKHVLQCYGVGWTSAEFLPQERQMFGVPGGFMNDWNLMTNIEGLFVGGDSLYASNCFGHAAATGSYAGRKAAAYAEKLDAFIPPHQPQVDAEIERVYKPLYADPITGASWKEINEAFRELEQSGELTVRVYEQANFTDGKALAEQGNAPLPVEKKESGLPAERQSSRWGLSFFSTMANWLNRSQGSKISASEEPERLPSALSDSDWLKDAGPLWNWEQDPDTARGLREIFERFLLENREKIQLSQERRFLTAYRSRHRR